MKLKNLCEQINIPYNSKNSTRSLNAIKKEYFIEQNGNKKDYSIIRPLTDEEKILNIKLVPYKNQFHVKEEDKNKGGIYKIELSKEKKIYIGQTKNFYNRFCRHCNPSTYSLAKDIIKQGAIFSVIELEDNEHERFAKEAYWSKYYKENGYKLLNKEEVLFKAQHENKLKTILQKHNIDDDVINEIIKEYYSKNGGY